VKLRVVATPIGNLADLSPRAADALREAAIVLCEDTRHSRPLLDKIGARGRLVSCHAHNERERRDLVVEALARGEAVALITDAGAPSVSDPGGKIVEEVVAAGHEVEVLPGPSALVAALMGAGMDVARFLFVGFLPQRGKARRALLQPAAQCGAGVVAFESMNRMDDTLADLHRSLGARRVVVARELTKLHETFHRGVLGGVLSPPLVDKGEAVIVVAAGEPRATEAVDVDALAQDASLPPKERARRIAEALGISTREAYDRVRSAGPLPDPPPFQEREREHDLSTACAPENADALGPVDVSAEITAVAALLAQAAERLERLDASRQAPTDAATRSSPSGKATSEIPGADALLALLSRRPALRAPVEETEAARALLAAIERVDALADALVLEATGAEERRR
jgi:16S rRNA (cytidine1402-2'-O)-methyltransferase